jgi:hypothetical protein
VRARGELQLGVLIEGLRREGFEFSVSPPAVVFRHEDGQRLEPLEEVTAEVGAVRAAKRLQTPSPHSPSAVEACRLSLPAVDCACLASVPTPVLPPSGRRSTTSTRAPSLSPSGCGAAS